IDVQSPPTQDQTVLLDVNPAVRYPLLIFNIILCMLGASMLLIGLYTLLETWEDAAEDDQDTIRRFDLYSWAVTRMEVLVAAVGLVFFFVSCCGCVGALRENTLLLRTYSLVLTLLIIIGLLFGIIIFFMPSNVKKLIQDTLSDSLVIHYRDTADSQQFVDAVQRHLQCCGMSYLSFRDWNKNIYFNCSTQNPSQERCAVPHSCCKRNSTGELLSLFCGRRVLNMSDYDAWFKIHIGNCPDAAHRFVREHVMIVGGACLVVVVVLSFLDMIANSVVEEIYIIRKIYRQIHSVAALPSP
ncbi:unnamed protein product, partial [Ixodes hexagonus]